jgi:zinc transport system substrate-binding protein
MKTTGIKFMLAGIFVLWTHHHGAATDSIPVFVSIIPQVYFVQQIGKNRVDVQAMVQPGANPATYEPKPRQMAVLSSARAYFAIGVAFEKTWLPKIAAANPRMEIVHTDQGIDKIPMSAHHHEVQESGPREKAALDEKGAAHGSDNDFHDALDPHIWLSPPLVKKQAQNILIGLQEFDPSRAAFYQANYRAFISRIDELDAELKDTFAGRRGLQFMVFHPAWGYFAKAYGLVQVPVEIEGKSPKPAQLKALIEHARKKGIGVVFAQPQFSAKSAGIIAREIGGQVVFADPLAKDWMVNLTVVAGKFKNALK